MYQQRLKRALSSDAFFIGLAIAVILLMGIPRLDMTGFWDEPKVYLKPLFALYDDFFGYFAAPLTKTHRPPGLHFLYLPFLWIFGPEMVVIRALDLIYFSVGLFFFYKVIAAEDKFLAKLSLAFALLTPIFQVYSVQYVGEPQLFVLISLYLYLLTFHQNKMSLIFFLGIFIGLVREPSLALVPGAMAMLYLKGERGKKFFWLVGPLIGCLIYWIFTYIKTGGFISHNTSDQLDLLSDFSLRAFKTWQTFLAPYRMIPLISLSAILFLIGRNWKKPSPLTAFTLVLFLSYLFVFSGHREGIPRYFYSVFPFAVYLFLRPVVNFVKLPVMRFAAILLVLLPPLLIGNPTRKENSPFYAFQGYQDSWDHLEIVRLHHEVIAEVKKNWPAGSLIMTSWPFPEMFMLNYGGYGPRIDYRLTSKLEAGESPDVILHTHYPRYIDNQTVEAILKSGNYSERVYSFKDYQLRLIEKRSSK